MSLRASMNCSVGDLQIDVDITAGNEIVTLLGPNGAGKTSMLRALAGLVPVAHGKVELDGEVLTDTSAGVNLPPQHRSIGVAFQEHLLFPHMTVLENVAYGLRARGVRKGPATRTAAAWVDRVGLGHRLGARPDRLSGGEAQRAALARALAFEPRMVLLDEPLSAIDFPARAELRRLLLRVLEAAEGPRIVVTHDPMEAAMLGHRVMILEAGRITHAGTSDEILKRPRSAYAAGLAGTNLMRGRAVSGRVDVAGTELFLADPVDGDVFVSFHPRTVALYRRSPEGTPRNVWSGRIAALDHEGDRVRVEVTGDAPVVAEVTAGAVADLDLAVGTEVWAAVKATEIDAYPA